MPKSIVKQNSLDSSKSTPDTRIVPKQNEVHDDGTENQHVWGFADTKYQLTAEDGHVEITGNRYATSGQKLPSLLPWFARLMKVEFPREQLRAMPPTPESLPESVRNEPFLSRLSTFMAEDQVSLDPLQRLRHGHGHSLEDMHEVNYSHHIARIPDVVLYPNHADQVIAIVEAARHSHVCLVPFGGGTNVSRALRLPADERRTVAAVSTRRLNRVLWIDKVNRLARIEAGAMGRHIAGTLAAHGMTLGHEPDSVEFSTLGGWIATKASGMKKNRYGNIEDIVLDIEVVTLDGVLSRTSDATPPRESIGVDVRSWVFGSEGELGIVTSAVVKIFPLPEVQRYGSILFHSFDAGLAFLYGVAQSGDQPPASVRLVDNMQFQFSMALKSPVTGLLRAIKSRAEKAYVTGIRGFDPQSMVACTLVFEGSETQVRAQEAVAYGLARRHGGMKAGAANGQRGYEMTFAIAYIRDFAMSLGVLAESFETSCAWSAAPELCRRVKQRVRDEHAALGLPGEPFVSSRISQVYHTGVAVYFYLAIFAGDSVDDPVRVYGALEEAARDEILLCGGSLSHHHGLGTLRRKFVPRVLSAAACAYRRRVKAVEDPDGIFPGREEEPVKGEQRSATRQGLQ